MLKWGNKKSQKVIIFILLLFFVLSNFYGIMFVNIRPAKAQWLTSDIPMLGVTVGNDFFTKIWDELKAVFFKNVLGNLLNLIAQQTAVWVASGAKGQGPQWITDFDQFINGYADAAIGDFITTTIGDLTGINICTLDPRIAINLALSIPMFPESQANTTPACTFTQLRSHWEEVGKGQFITFNATIGAGGSFSQDTSRFNTAMQGDQTLQTWYNPSGPWPESYVGGCPSNTDAAKVVCAQPPIQSELQTLAAQLSADTAALAGDINKMMSGAGSEQTVQLSVGSWRITPENIDPIKQAWLNKINPAITKLDAINQAFSGCKNVSAIQLVGGQCKVILPRLGVSAPASENLTGSLETYFRSDVNSKASYVASMASTGKSGYEYLKSQISDKFNPDYFESGVPFNSAMANDLFNPEASEFNAYEEMQKEIANIGLEAYLNQHLQALVNQGWQASTDTIAGFVRTPASLLNAKATKDLTGNDSAMTYTKSIAADAIGVFLQTLWNQYMTRLLQSLASPQQQDTSKTSLTQTLLAKRAALQEEALKAATPENPVTEQQQEQTPLPVSNPSNRYEQETVTIEGVQNYIERLGEQFSVNYSFKDVDLLSDFQLNIKGKISPNIYNNVVDPNFALAINDQMTIQQAITKGKLIGSYKFSWGEKAVSGTYNLANIKKLRKARVLPLGFELAAELIRDCNWRQDNGYGSFQDVNDSAPRGGGSDSYINQRLQDCVFMSGDKNDYDVNDNKGMMTQVINASLADVVNGFDKRGDDNICGTFDANESPFCNLIDPNWVLKLPPTRCLLSSSTEPYGEIIQSTDIGTRYSRCPDFVSCLNDDGKGGCINEQYGVCVKEKNYWQFAANSCPSDFNSCRTYTASTTQGTSVVSYLKNTLSGNEICGPDNAGCAWYATIFSSGAWQGQSSRIYLNRYAETCDKSNEGCNEFFLYRDPSMNLITDSSFEYTSEGVVPENWDLIIKEAVGTDKIITGQDKCEDTISNNATGCSKGNCSYQEYCLDYKYPNQDDCLANNGKWENDSCTGAINTTVMTGDCTANGGQFQQYCYYSPLKYNQCANVQFATQALCKANMGSWQEECRVAGEVQTNVQSEANCVASGVGGNWITYCQGVVQYDLDKAACAAVGGQWNGYGPFSEYVSVSKDGSDTQGGISKLVANLGALKSDQELQLIYTSQLNQADKILTKPGDVYTATAYIKANNPINSIQLNLIKGSNDSPEVTSKNYELSATSYATYTQLYATLATTTEGTSLKFLINLPAPATTPAPAQPTKVYLDNLTLALNSFDQIRSNNFYTTYADYEINTKVYYKKPPVSLNCRGYGPGDPPPVINPGTTLTKEDCTRLNGYWDEAGIFIADKRPVCYKYAPDDPACSNFMKVCQPEEVGCQIYKPNNGDPEIPGVVSISDYCPTECVGYNQYKQDSTLYEPSPDPQFYNFIPNTAKVCSVDQVGCSQFTNLDEVAAGGEGITYYTYLRQCIKPNQGKGEKTFFSRHNVAAGGPQVIKYELQQDATGAPKTFDGSGDCRGTGSDLNCLEFFDDQGNTYFRDIRVTISVSDDCHPFRKTESTAENCTNTGGQWQADNNCLYNAIPSENIACSAEVNGCRTFIGNRGNNVYNQLFDVFEGGNIADWTSAAANTNLSLSSESVIVGGHSLFVAQGTGSIAKDLSIKTGSIYTLSFWAKSENNQSMAVKFSTASGDKEKIFAATINLTSNWQNFNLGPLYIESTDSGINQLKFEGFTTSGVYLDNILLKVINNNVYLVKNSWTTPKSCDFHYVGEMLGCQAYTDVLNQTHNLKSFTSICRGSVVGCQLLVDTKNSTDPKSQAFNSEDTNPIDDYQVPQDELTTYVLDSNKSCAAENKGCQKLGRPSGLAYDEVYLKNNPDKYINVPKAIMCNDSALGCTELTNDSGGVEYYKIDPTKLCEFGQHIINGQTVSGWYKQGSSQYGCNSLSDGKVNINEEECTSNGNVWSDKYSQCTVIISDITNQIICESQKNEWVNNKCLANPFSIYRVYEANKYKGYVGLCDRKYNGCTEFRDVNDNYVFNGSFETGLVATALANWHDIETAGEKGEKQVVTDNVKQGKKAIKLVKTQNAGGYGIYTLVAKIEKNRTYKISFYYRVPAEAIGNGAKCALPRAAFSFVKADMSVTASDLHYYDPDNSWKRVEYLFKAPVSQTEITADYNLTLYSPESASCVNSFIIYDLVEVKDNTEDSYNIIDLGSNVDRKSCLAVNWDLGCVQFQNTSSDSYETIKVKKDRICDQWVMCSKQNQAGQCTETQLCAEEFKSQCTRLAPQNDNVRYNSNSQGLIITRIADSKNQNGYIYRFGAGSVSRITQWRAGDYSGYTIPDRYALETDQKFIAHPYENQLGAFDDPRFNEPVCKIFPAEDSPLPYQLSQNTAFKNLQNMYSQTYYIDKIGNGCFYEKATAVGTGGVSAYFPRGTIDTNNSKMCTSPQENIGVLCSGGAAAACTSSVDQGDKVSKEEGKCDNIGSVKEFSGLEAMCLEVDTLSPIFGSLNLGDLYNNSDSQTQYENYRPYACLTYFPFVINTCPLHRGVGTCILNPACVWSESSNSCSAK